MDKINAREEAKESIDKLFDELDKLEAKKEEAEDAAKAEYADKITDLKLKQKELELKYKALADSSDETWKDAKKDFNASVESFKTGLSKLKSLFE